MDLGVKLRRVMSSIMRRRKGVMCGSFASGRGVEETTPSMMPQRSREEASSPPGVGTAPGQWGRGTRCGEGGERRKCEDHRDPSGSSFLPTAKRFSSILANVPDYAPC